MPLLGWRSNDYCRSFVFSMVLHSLSGCYVILRGERDRDICTLIRLPYLPTERRSFCREKHVVLRQISPCICIEGVDGQIIKSKSKCGRGTVSLSCELCICREG